MKNAAILLVVFGALTASCWERLSDDCTISDTCPPPDAGSGGGGSGGGLPAGCVPSESTEAVGDNCGVFVSSSLGDDSAGSGSKDAPYATIAQALSALGGARAVYLCGESYAEAVQLPAGVSLYGGLRCQTGWSYAADTRASIEAPADMIGLSIAGEGTSAIEDVNVTAASATAPGGSSIAVLVDGSSGAEVNATRCDFTAGDGAAGMDGAPAAAAEPKALAGNNGENACSSMTSQIFGGAAQPNPACMTSIGGSGGIGVTNGNGGNGQKGQPGDVMEGLGEGETGAELACTQGANGLPGTAGTPGAGGSTLGTIGATGYVGADGEPGQAGTIAQGGGGGGGAKGGMICMGGNQSGPGASGGSGGPGGCGGLGGNAGTAGGSSISLINLGADVQLNECRLITGQGGKGGNGALGQAGQLGGDGGNGGAPSGVAGSNPACDGGDGGKGGDGGPGGGGRGGHSLGIAYTSTMPTLSGSTIMTGDFGAGGDSTGNSGSAGIKADSQSFD